MRQQWYRTLEHACIQTVSLRLTSLTISSPQSSLKRIPLISLSSLVPPCPTLLSHMVLKNCLVRSNHQKLLAQMQFLVVFLETAHEIAPILADIFNCSLSTGILPRDWKSANVAPVFKKGNTNLRELPANIADMCMLQDS